MFLTLVGDGCILEFVSFWRCMLGKDTSKSCFIDSHPKRYSIKTTPYIRKTSRKEKRKPNEERKNIVLILRKRLNNFG